MSEQYIFDFFAGYAYEPLYVYSFVILFMLASSFGLPIPEEITLISVGVVAHMARVPELYPPPYPGAEGVNLFTLATVCFVAVVGSDLLIYFLGKVYGKKIVRTKLVMNRIGQERFNKINDFFHKYSYWACGIFRFTPGIRFPGHLSCGMMGIPLWKFLLVDGIAALVSVPTQVILVAIYGQVILAKISEFKIVIVSFFGAIILFWLLRKLYFFLKNRRAT